MPLQTLQVKHTVTYREQPLAVVDNLPGSGAELTPAQLRLLASALLAVADDCEVLYDSTRRMIPVRRQYPVEA